MSTDNERKLALCLLKKAEGRWLLDPDGELGLRVKCDNLPFHITKHELASDYPCCQGRNWSPNPGYWEYVRAADFLCLDAGIQGTIPDRYILLFGNVLAAISSARRSRQNPVPLAFKVVADALLAWAEEK